MLIVSDIKAMDEAQTVIDPILTRMKEMRNVVREAGSEFKQTAVYWLVYMLGHSSQHEKLAVSSNIQLCIGWCIC